MTALDAARRDYRIDCLADGHTEVAQCPEILRRLNRDLLSAQIHYRQRGQHLPGCVEVSFASEALEHFRQDQIADGQGLAAEQAIEPLGLWCDRAVEVIDPDAGIDKDTCRSS